MVNEWISRVRDQSHAHPRWLTACVAVVAVLVGGLVMVVGCDSDPTPPRNTPILIKGANVNIGLLTDLPGWSDFDRERSAWKGFQYDLMNRLDLKLGMTMTPVPVTFEDRVRRMRNGEIKVMLANFSMTDDR